MFYITHTLPPNYMGGSDSKGQSVKYFQIFKRVGSFLAQTLTKVGPNKKKGVYFTLWKFNLHFFTYFILLWIFELNCGALRDLIPFVQFKNREKHPWRSVKFRILKSTLLHGRFSGFLKLLKWYQIAQRITISKLLFKFT